MGAPRRIKKTSSYPTTDEKSFPTYKEAIEHQTDIDIDAACEGGDINSDDLKAFLKKNSNKEAVTEYMKHHGDKPPAPKKKAAKKPPASST